MLIKIVIALMIVGALCIPGKMNYEGLKNSISDVDKINMLCIMDDALIHYYCNHSGELPNSLNETTIKMLGLEKHDWTEFQYSKTLNSFTVSVPLSDGTLKQSGNSGKTLSNVSYNND